ncbi:MAG: sigma factor-like helix-turn-helix DNA-binding protein [Clostridia bacterium]|nr:sigma factor-like helix-turn-helix DNA-binding protein [Clostridia bacterium]
MERLIELGRLYDYYGMLLSERQSLFVDAYVNENLSLAEIAEREGVTRQAVRAGIVQAEEHLRSLEQKLRMIERTETTRALIREFRTAVETTALDAAERQLLLRGADAIGAVWEE